MPVPSPSGTFRKLHTNDEARQPVIVGSQNGNFQEYLTPCGSGQIRLRLYEGEGGAFLGVDTGYIEGHIFQTVVFGIDKPTNLAIKYSIVNTKVKVTRSAEVKVTS